MSCNYRSLKQRIKQAFTLIELLIVIGLLGALTALVLPALSADREEALGAVCDYNQAGSVRTLKQYINIISTAPSGFHTGLQDNLAHGVTDPMEGIPDAQFANLVTNEATTNVALTANQAASLVAAGITQVAHGTGYNLIATAEDVHVQRCDAAWVDDGGGGYQFDGRTIAEWEADTSAGIIVALWITPTMDWAVGDAGNLDWSKGNVELKIDMEGKCPIPTAGINGDPEFSYYMAFFKVYDDGSAAELIGSCCPECGILNP